MSAVKAAQTEIVDIESARAVARARQAALPDHDSPPVMALPDGTPEDYDRWLGALDVDIAAAEAIVATCQAQLAAQKPVREALAKARRSWIKA